MKNIIGLLFIFVAFIMFVMFGMAAFTNQTEYADDVITENESSLYNVYTSSKAFVETTFNSVSYLVWIFLAVIVFAGLALLVDKM